MAPANPLPSESSIHVEGLAVNVVSSLDIESTNSVKLTKAISAATHLISSFSAQFPTLVTLLPGAKESLAGLEEAHQDKRQRLAEPAGSSSSIVHAQGTPVELAGSSSSIVHAQVMPVAVVVAPKGGSLNQEQVDALVGRGVTTNGINDLAQLPLAMSSPLCDQLLAAGPEVQKGLINKMRTAMVSYAWKVSVGTSEALVNARLAELAKEAIASDREEKQAARMESQISIANDKRIAHPWLSFFQRPIPASEWTAPVLNSFCEQREGLRLLLDGATGLNVKFNELTVICQLPTFVEILAYYPMYDSSRYRWVQADGFVGKFLHPSGEVVHIHFVYHHCMWIEGARDAVYKNVHLTGIPALDSMPSHQMPWMRTPKPGLPKLVDETAIGPLSDFIAACTLTSGVFTNDLKGKTEFNRCAEESSNLKLDAENETNFSTFRSLFKTYCTNKNIVLDEDWLTYSYLSRFNIQRYVSLKDGSDSVTGFKKVDPWSIRHSQSSTPAHQLESRCLPFAVGTISDRTFEHQPFQHPGHVLGTFLYTIQPRTGVSSCPDAHSRSVHPVSTTPPPPPLPSLPITRIDADNLM